MVGALPLFPSNALKYNLTWSTAGLINEYCNPCEAIYDGELREVLPLEGYEQFSLDGVTYEAFNTSGGLGTLCETLKGKVDNLSYKTIRYPGHCELVKLLVNDLRLGKRRDVFKDVLEHAVSGLLHRRPSQSQGSLGGRFRRGSYDSIDLRLGKVRILIPGLPSSSHQGACFLNRE